MTTKKPPKKRVWVHYANEQADISQDKFIQLSEERYRRQVIDTAKKIADNINKYKIILIAGPSSSGKTTTSLILRKTLYQLGVKSITIALDDFFLDRDQLPLMENGDKDYESVRALDIQAVKTCFNELLEQHQSNIPIFNFEEGGRIGYKKIRMSAEHVVIVEGIHGLNPIIFPEGHDENFYKIYISVRTEYEQEDKIILNTRYVRLMRRLIRDHNFRGSSIENTLSMWKNVCKGEEMNIHPYRLDADVWIDSLHLYEPFVYKEKLLPLLTHVSEKSIYNPQIKKLKKSLSYFMPYSIKKIPENSMLHEFVP